MNDEMKRRKTPRLSYTSRAQSKRRRDESTTAVKERSEKTESVRRLRCCVVSSKNLFSESFFLKWLGASFAFTISLESNSHSTIAEDRIEHRREFGRRGCAHQPSSSDQGRMLLLISLTRGTIAAADFLPVA